MVAGMQQHGASLICGRLSGLEMWLNYRRNRSDFQDLDVVRRMYTYVHRTMGLQPAGCSVS